MDSRFGLRDPNTAATAVWQGLVVRASRSAESWRNKGVSSLYAPGSQEFLLGYRGYILVLRLEVNDIVASIQNQSHPLANISEPRRFNIAGGVAAPTICEGGIEWTFPGMIDELISWFCRVVDSRVDGDSGISSRGLA